MNGTNTRAETSVTIASWTVALCDDGGSVRDQDGRSVARFSLADGDVAEFSGARKFVDIIRLALPRLTVAGDSAGLPAHTSIADTTANPAPLGLMGFGLTTILLNLHNAGFIGLGSMILGMGIFYGGIAQIIAGLMEWKKKNTFGTLAFTSYGLFWISLVALLVLPKLGLAEATDSSAMAAYLFFWGVFSAILFIGTFRLPVSMRLVFAMVTLLFFLLALADATGSATLTRLAGYEGILCGASAVYLAAAQVLNEVYGRDILPT